MPRDGVLACGWRTCGSVRVHCLDQCGCWVTSCPHREMRLILWLTRASCVTIHDVKECRPPLKAPSLGVGACTQQQRKTLHLPLSRCCAASAHPMTLWSFVGLIPLLCGICICAVYEKPPPRPSLRGSEATREKSIPGTDLLRVPLLASEELTGSLPPGQSREFCENGVGVSPSPSR